MSDTAWRRRIVIITAAAQSEDLTADESEFLTEVATKLENQEPVSPVDWLRTKYLVAKAL